MYIFQIIAVMLFIIVSPLFVYRFKKSTTWLDRTAIITDVTLIIVLLVSFFSKAG